MRNSNLFCTHFAARRLFAQTSAVPHHQHTRRRRAASRRTGDRRRRPGLAGCQPATPPVTAVRHRKARARQHAGSTRPERLRVYRPGGSIRPDGPYGPSVSAAREREGWRWGASSRLRSVREGHNARVGHARARPTEAPARWWSATRVCAVRREQQGIARTRSGAHAWRAAPASGATRASTL